MAVPEQIGGVAVKLKANVYFDGKVVSHTLLFPDGKKKTAGVIFPGTFHFNTDAAERMDILSGSCRVQRDGETAWLTFSAGTYFTVPPKSGFQIAVDSDRTDYLCSFD